jgi:hypothetical protein
VRDVILIQIVKIAPHRLCIFSVKLYVRKEFQTVTIASMVHRKKGRWNLKKIFSSETTEPISTKLC